eukprot:TRINITY_DN66499_c0_g1_i1.p2 TRINITY_DN66499_c0_g1~~TRINITY_DN66499_c0_g1_i1.p2  ORF type:complete len:211 (+),score=102.53 TRINITY_DN66499_c0_g1_i1:71-634(+)
MVKQKSCVLRGRDVPTDIDELLQKHAVTQQPEFLQRRRVPNLRDDKRLKQRARKKRESTLTEWGGMRKGPQTKEAKQALNFIRYGNYLSDDRKFERPKKEPLPEFFEFGEEVGSGIDLNRPYEKKRRRVTPTRLVNEILLDSAAQRAIKDNRAAREGKGIRKRTNNMRRNKKNRKPGPKGSRKKGPL